MPHEMEHIRRVYDEVRTDLEAFNPDLKGRFPAFSTVFCHVSASKRWPSWMSAAQDVSNKKFSSIASPREDAQMFRSSDARTVPCECIVELYELLWRWGHRKKSRFFENFGFTVPDTVVIAKGRPYAWYFISASSSLEPSGDKGRKSSKWPGDVMDSCHVDLETRDSSSMSTYL